MRVYNQHNLPYLAKPGSDLFAAARLEQMRKMDKEYYKRLLAGQSKEEARAAVTQEFQNPNVSYQFTNMA
jgi:hypothetical protein